MNKIFNKKDVIFKQGENATCMYEVHTGSVGIYSGYGTDHEKLLTELKSGTFFGEMGLIDQMPRSAAAVVLEDHTEITVISQDNFQNYLKDHPEKMMEIMQHMSGRIRNLTNNYLDACRAVSEALESEKNGKEKSNWFKSKVDRFLKDYRASLEAEMAQKIQYDVDYIGKDEIFYYL